MKALTFQGTRRVAYESVADPRIEEPTDVIVRNRLTAICGSDLHVYRGREVGNDRGTPMGHEFVGEVVEVGSDVSSLKRGDKVVSPFTTSCGACFYCHHGLTCRCTRGQLYGWVENGIGLPGAQAEYVRVPLADSTAFKIPDDVDEESALFLGDVLATGFFCAEMANVRPGGTYAVIGCGPVGLLAVVGARELGAENVFAVDTVSERLALAAAFGATSVNAREQNPKAVVEQATEGRGADGVLEAVGSPEASRLAIELVRPGGVISAVGVHTEPSFSFSPTEAYDKNLTYRAGRCPARYYIERLLPLIRERRYDLGAIVSHRLPLAEAVRGYELFDKKLDGCTKVVLTL
jgi:threonine dehydrogenase-like Zn-dependent dehydrogenase